MVFRADFKILQSYIIKTSILSDFDTFT